MNRSACTICSDFLTVSNCTACPCGHTFHYECIITWREHSATCPQCRVRFKEPIKLFFDQNTAEESDVDDAALRNQLTDLKLKLKQKDISIESMKQQHTVATNEMSVKQQEINTLSQLLTNSQGTNEALKKQISYLEKYKIEAQRARSEIADVGKKMNGYQNISDLIYGERHDVEAMVKTFADTPDSLNQIVTSFVCLKKEFDVIKEKKKKLENEKKLYRRKAETATQKAYENKGQLEVLTNDLTHLNELNKSLQQKLRKLEQSFASPSPRSSAIKRLLMESPAPMDLKRARMDDIQDDNGADGSIILFDGTDDEDSGCPNESPADINLEEEVSKEIATEFGLHYVSTTSMGSDRPPLKDVNRNHGQKGGFAIMKSNSLETDKASSASSSLPHLRKGYNGMGGQSKVLVIPKKTSTFIKPIAVKQTRRIKIPRNNTKISKFLAGPKLPSINSP